MNAPDTYQSSGEQMESRDSGVVDLRHLLIVFRRRIALFFAVAIIAIALVITITFQLTPRYKASTELIIDPRQEQVIDQNQVLSGLTPNTSVVLSEVQIIKSRSLAGKVVDALHLIDNPEFNPDLVVYSGFSLWRHNASTYLSNTLKAILPKPKQSPTTSFEGELHNAKDVAVSILLNKLSVRRSGLTYVIMLQFESTNAHNAALIANTIAEKYMVDQLESKFDATKRANEWLEDRLSSLRREVQASERAVEIYRAQEGLLNAEGSSLTEKQIAELTGSAIILRAELAEKQARLNTVDQQLKSGSGGDVAAVLDSTVIKDLRSRQADITRRQGELQSRYGARHPEILKVKNELADVENQINQQIQRIVSSLRGEVSVARQRLSSLERDKDNLTKRLTSNNTAMVRLRELERDASANRTLYESFLDRFKQTSQQQSLLEADARIISRATPSMVPSFPNKRIMLLLGLVLAAASGGAAVLAAEALDRGIHTSSDVEYILGVPCLASLPIVRRNKGAVDPASYVMDKPLSSFSEALRTMRAALLYAGDGDGNSKIIAITSALPGEGKTSMALSLARVSAMMGAKTLVIDADIRRRTLTEATHINPKIGLVDLIEGRESFSNVVMADKQKGLDILPLAPRNDNLTLDIFGRPAMRKLLDALRESYEFVIIDTAPTLPVAETRVLATIVDFVVLLVRWRKTPREVAKSAIDSLVRVNAPLAGIVLTQVDLAAMHTYGYGYGSYYKSYHKYYNE